jgi:hypothetical protein
MSISVNYKKQFDAGKYTIKNNSALGSTLSKTIQRWEVHYQKQLGAGK